MMMDKFDLQVQLEDQLIEVINQKERLQAIENYIEIVDKNNDRVTENFGKDLEWLNTEKSLSLETFRGRVVVLDFFTYCCVNCLHILPVLSELERNYALNQEVVVIGVHSAKFDNERSSKNVANAILKYDIHHAVVNDCKAEIWESLKIQCWPTLVIIGPEGQQLFTLVGEGHGEKLFQFVEATVQFYRKRNKLMLNERIPVKLLKDSLLEDTLSFPGKITIFPDKGLVAVSDSGHHRIIFLSPDGVIRTTIGGSGNGFKDGTFSDAQFCNPQGIAISKNGDIYIADTGNHAIRKVDYLNCRVDTVVGTGTQGTDKEGGNIGNQQSISSPWDICLGPSLGVDATLQKESILYIAMSGLHQIWGLCLEDIIWQGQKKLKGVCFSVAGNGNEENRNNCYPKKAGFAQPSGVTYANIVDSARNASHPTLFIADSESSSIRSISLLDGAVKAVVGGDRNPTNLFAYGDVDGSGVDVKLQHPLGVTWCSEHQELYVADSYNHKIKIIDPVKKICKTYEGVFELQEPGGVSICEHLLFVTDTNNHAIKVLDLKSGRINKLPIRTAPIISNAIIEDVTDSCLPPSRDESDLSLSISPVEVSPGGKISLSFNIIASQGTTFTQGAPQTWSINILANNPIRGLKSGSFSSNGSMQRFCQIELFVDQKTECGQLWPITVNGKVVLCKNDAGICASRVAVWTIDIAIKENGPSQSKLSLRWKVTL